LYLDLLRELLPKITEESYQMQRAIESKLDRKLAALQALDVGYRDKGYIVLMCKVRNRDYCEVIEIPPNFPLEEYRKLSQMLKDNYGMRPSRIDLPTGIPRDLFED
jgi:hypothetical protein